MAAVDTNQLAAGRAGDDAASFEQEDVMHKRASRAIAEAAMSEAGNSVAWWTMGLWGLALVYLLATFSVY